MCGVFAVLSADGQSGLKDLARLAIDKVKHRGPDDDSVACGRSDREETADSRPLHWALGHSRLSILDLSINGRQPMATKDRKQWISFNGEIYNYLELREELAECGFVFRTESDTEVLMAAYLHWGEACVSKFIGMFAFVIVDLDRQRCFIARDFVGIKPLFVWQYGRQTAVVSEPKQLLVFPEFEPTMNSRLAVEYLIDGLLDHDPDACLFADVRRLPAGQTLSWDLNGIPNWSERKTFWQPPRTSVACSWDDARQRVRDSFLNAVRLRLRADVPVGACLSGGIDSSTIVGVMSRILGVSPNTFSSCSHDPRFDEQFYIDAVNRFCHSQPHKVYPTAEQLIADFDQFIYHQDEPVFAVSQYSEFCLMRLARENGVTVLLNGQGGDEAMWGYWKYAYFLLRQLLGSGEILSAVKLGAQILRNGDRQILDLRRGKRYLPKFLRQQTASVADYLGSPYRGFVGHAWHNAMAGVTDVRDHQWADLTRWSLPVLLRYQDRNSMAHGIESRVPFTDHRFLELFLQMPQEFFFVNGQTKRIFVEAFADELPREVKQRRTKMGFATPQSEWMRGQFGEFMEMRVRECEPLSMVLKVDDISRQYADYRQGKSRLNSFELFRIGCLAAWIRQFNVKVRDEIIVRN